MHYGKGPRWARPAPPEFQNKYYAFRELGRDTAQVSDNSHGYCSCLALRTKDSAMTTECARYLDVESMRRLCWMWHAVSVWLGLFHPAGW
jgi:hypothetical protein